MGLLAKLFGQAERTEQKEMPVEAYQKMTIYSPLKGEEIPLEEVSDPVFSQGVMGKGAAIIPADGKLYAPVNGVVEALFNTRHAIGIRSEDGMELLIHIGVDTVEMNGDGFQAYVKQGESVKAGKLLIEFDVQKIRDAGYDPVTMILVSNYQQFGKMKVSGHREVQAMEKLIQF